jgi:mono/diheme cytochrome c family protein
MSFRTWTMTGTATVLGLAMLAAGARAEETAAHPGKKVFLDNKCNACHGVKSQDIAVAAGGDAEEKDPPPDLSNVGNEQKPEFLSAYLLKKEMLHDKKHQKRFGGTEQELKDLVAWLASLKVEKQ